MKLPSIRFRCNVMLECDDFERTSEMILFHPDHPTICSRLEQSSNAQPSDLSKIHRSICVLGNQLLACRGSLQLREDRHMSLNMVLNLPSLGEQSGGQSIVS